MPTYVPLARKWRPAQLSDLVGQDPIVRTMSNAIQSDRVHHAYLFTGSRGVGKTSMARIFSKALRCDHLDKSGQLLKSCDQCSNCKEITHGNGVDVIEIDGASNNGVEAIREIRENAKYLPSSGSKKIYIIDEVHMLSTAAFNALLKTLEEPPEHVIFIFATTEPHKIPATILSRCQRFDFRRVSATQIQKRLAMILNAEQIKADPSVLYLIARSSDGSMRDSLSLLDQVIAYCGSEITIEQARDCMGILDGQTLLQILKGIFEKKPLESIATIEKCYEQGQDLRILTRSLLEFLHAVILAKVGSKNSSALELSSEEWEEVQTISKLRTLEEMELFFQVFHYGLEWVAKSPQPVAVLNVLVIKCASSDALMTLNTESAKPSAALEPIQKSAPPPKTTEEPTAPLVESAASRFKSIRETLTQPHSEKKNSSALSPPLTSTPPTSGETPQQNEEVLSENKPAVDLSQIKKTWENFIQYVRTSRPFLASILEHSLCKDLDDANFQKAQDGVTLNIQFLIADEYFEKQLKTKLYRDQLRQLSKEFFEKNFVFQIELSEAGETIAQKKEKEKKEQLRARYEKAKNHPIILEAHSLFGGDLGPIRIKGQETHHVPN